MTVIKYKFLKYGILAFAICMLCTSLVFAEQTVAEPIPAGPGLEGPGTAGTDTGGAVVPVLLPGFPAPVGPQVETADAAPEVTGTNFSEQAILSTPILESPSNNTHFLHYPRATTLAWKLVTYANQYKLERQYYSGGTWYTYSDIYTNAPATSYTFNFVGDQPGRWRVTAYDTTGVHPASNPSNWRVFDFKTGAWLSAPTLVSPPNNINFYNYPRTTTLAWKPVPGASGYKVEISYFSGSWFPTEITTTNAWYTFNFVGAQPGRWRVSAIGGQSGGTLYWDSLYSAYRGFTYHI